MSLSIADVLDNITNQVSDTSAHSLGQRVDLVRTPVGAMPQNSTEARHRQHQYTHIIIVVFQFHFLVFNHSMNKDDAATTNLLATQEMIF